MSITADNNFNLFCTEGTEVNPLNGVALAGPVEQVDQNGNKMAYAEKVLSSDPYIETPASKKTLDKLGELVTDV